MSGHCALDWVPAVEEAIDRCPLIVPPTLALVDAIALLSQSHHRRSLPDVLDQATQSPVEPWLQRMRASCVVVMQGTQIVGILTERDVVRLTAQGIPLQGFTIGEVMTHPVVTLPYPSLQDIFGVLFLFRRYRIRHLPILNEHQQLVGVVSHTSLRQVLRPANLLRLRRVADVMITDVVQAPLNATVLQLVQLMNTEHVSCVVIMQRDEDGSDSPVGIVTERDIVQFQALQLDLAKTDAQTVMSTPLFLLRPEDSLWTAHEEMQSRLVGRLVVSWNWGKGLGLVTQTSLLRVFDPLEMCKVIETFQDTVEEIQGGRSPTHPNPAAAPPTPDLAPLRSRPTPSEPPTFSGGTSDRLVPQPLLDSVYQELSHLSAQMERHTADASAGLTGMVGDLWGTRLHTILHILEPFTTAPRPLPDTRKRKHSTHE